MVDGSLWIYCRQEYERNARHIVCGKITLYLKQPLTRASVTYSAVSFRNMIVNIQFDQETIVFECSCHNFEISLAFLKIIKCLWNSSSQKGTSSPLRRHLPMSGDIFRYHNLAGRSVFQASRRQRSGVLLKFYNAWSSLLKQRTIKTRR